MIRFIILFVVGYLFYRAVKTWMYPKTKTSRTVSGKTVGAIDDVMVKDPYCETYFAKRNGVYLNLMAKTCISAVRNVRTIYRREFRQERLIKRKGRYRFREDR
jgi:hypothetical protein